MAGVNDTRDQSLWTAEECLVEAFVRGSGGADDLLSGLWYVGVLMSIVSSIFSNLGVNVQKLSMMREMRKVQDDPLYEEKMYVFQKTWLIGLLMVILGSIGDFAALGFAAQTLATPVGGFTMVANIFFAHFFLNEHLTRRDLLATSLIVLGVIGVAASADKTEKQYTLTCLLKLYKRPLFLGYVGLIVSFVGVLYMLTRWLTKLRAEDPKGETYMRWKRLHPVCPSALSGFIGAQTVLFGKCSAELIKSTIAGENQFARWETYIIIVCMFFTIFNQLHWLAVGLKDFDAVLIIPIFQCFFITGGVLGGGVFFDEFSNIAPWERVVFAAGVLTTVLGVYLLSQREHSEPDFIKHVTPDGMGSSETNIIDPHLGVISVGPPGGAQAGRHPEFERPPTPMPLSLQYHGLAMSDLYTALRDTLSTPDRSRRHSFSRLVVPASQGGLAITQLQQDARLRRSNTHPTHADYSGQRRTAPATAAGAGADASTGAGAGAGADTDLPIGPGPGDASPIGAAASFDTTPAAGAPDPCGTRPDGSPTVKSPLPEVRPAW